MRSMRNSIHQIVAAGGVDEAGATEAAAKWMDRLYPNMREGMEQNTYLYSSDENPTQDSQVTLKYKNLYMVYFGAMHDYYYFYINADTGIMSSFTHSTSDFGKMGVSEAETRKAIEDFLPDAKKQLKETFGIQSYDKIYAYFTTTETEGNAFGGFSYHFVTDKGDDYILKYLVQTGELYEYTDTLYPEYVELAEEAEQFLKKGQENYEEKTTHKVELE